MKFEWDENKRLRNIERHGVDFIGAAQLFDGRPVLTYHTPRDGEDRWGTVGLIGERFHLMGFGRGASGKGCGSSRIQADEWEIENIVSYRVMAAARARPGTIEPTRMCHEESWPPRG